MKNKDKSILLEKRAELAKCVCFNFRKAARVVTHIYNEKMKSCGLKPTQVSILFVISAVGSATITHLAHILVMERTTLTRNLKPLEKLELISIDQGTDQRKRVVTLTDNGYEKVEKALPLWEEAQSYITSELGQERWNDLLGHLSATIALADKK